MMIHLITGERASGKTLYASDIGLRDASRGMLVYANYFLQESVAFESLKEIERALFWTGQPDLNLTVILDAAEFYFPNHTPTECSEVRVSAGGHCKPQWGTWAINSLYHNLYVITQSEQWLCPAFLRMVQWEHRVSKYIDTFGEEPETMRINANVKIRATSYHVSVLAEPLFSRYDTIMPIRRPIRTAEIATGLFEGLDKEP